MKNLSFFSLCLAMMTLLALAGPLQAAPPHPPAPPPIPAPPNTGYDHYTMLQAPAGNPGQIVFGTGGNDMIAQYGDANTVSQYAEGGGGAMTGFSRWAARKGAIRPL